MTEETSEKGFIVKDRRAASIEETSGEPKAAPSQRAEEPPAGAPPLPEASFMGLLYSLHASALMAMGEVPDPHSGETQADLPIAKHSIDILGVLRKKTQGNLDADEEKLLENILYDLRMRFVRVSSEKK
ncbi:MAG: DUF1844 domain-containing protein [Nitrospirae bacterium]|nr:DUF1844 domain-containing protein [Nitrospirota bacterium]